MHHSDRVIQGEGCDIPGFGDGMVGFAFEFKAQFLVHRKGLVCQFVKATDEKLTVLFTKS